LDKTKNISNVSPANYNKKYTPTTRYKQLYYEMIGEFPNYKHIYTDASKTNTGTGIAIITPNSQSTQKVNEICSIYTSEMLAIHSAIEYMKN